MAARKLDSLRDRFDVSRETIDRLEIYFALLIKWNPAINLVAKNTIADAAERHFADSLQLWRHRVPFKNWIDLGSGAGFPGLVMALTAKDAFPDSHFHLIESDARKCAFTRNVSRETSANVTVHNRRIEQLSDLSGEVVSARALASLDQLFFYGENLCNPHGIFLYLKGKNCDEEIKEARQNWQFDVEKHPSETDPSGKILSIRNLRRGKS